MKSITSERVWYMGIIIKRVKNHDSEKNRYTSINCGILINVTIDYSIKIIPLTLERPSAQLIRKQLSHIYNKNCVESSHLTGVLYLLLIQVMAQYKLL